MDVNPGGGGVVLLFLLLLAVAGCALLPVRSEGPVGVGPQAPHVVVASPAP